MSDRAIRNGKTLSLLIVSLLALGGLAVVLSAVTPAVRADTCGQSGSLLTGNWVVTTAQTCSGTMFYLDGNLYIRGTGSLTLVNGGITFVQDASHVHAMWVDSPGSLILQNSTLTTATNTLTPYVKLTATVNGTLALREDSRLKFPGNLLLQSGSTLNMTSSTITGFSDNELNGLGTPAWMDDNDDSPVTTMTASTAYLYQSTIEKIYENGQIGGHAANLTLRTGSVVYAYDTYIGVDFSNNWQIHNVMTLDATSSANFYNVTIDQVESDATPQYQRFPAFVPLPGGFVNIFRFMDGRATDPYGTPLVGATIWSHIGSVTATYPDNGNGLVPSSRTLWYIGRSAATFNVSDSLGWIRIPLWTDQITNSSFPNANSFGNYQATGTYQSTYIGNASAAFVPYPSITAEDNNLPVTVALPVPGLTPDLTIANVAISGGNGVSDFQPINRQFTVTATVHAAGANPVASVVVSFFAINVDQNSDTYMDSPVSAYKAANVMFGNVTIASVPANGDATASAQYTVSGSFETGVTISVVVNPPLGNPRGASAIPETNLRNDIAIHPMSVIVWPDLAVVDRTDVKLPVTPVANNSVPVDVTIHNLGTGAATGATLVLLEGTNSVSTQATFNVNPGAIATVEVEWTPTTVGNHTLTAYVMSSNTSIRNRDYNVTNNALAITQYVQSQPDLALFLSDYVTPLNVSQNRGFNLIVHIHNLGQTPVENTSVAVYLDSNSTIEYGRVDNIQVNQIKNVTVAVLGIPIPGTNHFLTIVVNPDRSLIEGGLGFTNDIVNLPMIVNAPSGTVKLYNPASGTTFGPTDQISVAGGVFDKTVQQNGIPSLTVTIAIINSAGQTVQSINVTTSDTGLFSQTFLLADLPDGTYTLRVFSSQGNIDQANPTIVIKRSVPFLSQLVPLLGIPWWLFLAIIAAVAVIVIAVTLYFKIYGLGKMVECGECGAFIPEDATVCPKCGVEFEKDMAKCSNCQAWIPVDVKQCPECGVEFATGEVEMADYQEKMRLQYDEVVQKFKEDASRQLGRALSDKEFQEWWRKQPTFLTFEDWLREEEEMRKMGSKPCPVCGTLNSVTATVCHKCGSLMKEDRRPPSGGAGSGGMAPSVRQRAAAPAAPPSDQGQAGGPQAAGAQAGARPVIRRAVTPAPVVQKRVIKRPTTEGEQAGATDESQDQSSGDQNQGDEL